MVSGNCESFIKQFNPKKHFPFFLIFYTFLQKTNPILSSKNALNFWDLPTGCHVHSNHKNIYSIHTLYILLFKNHLPKNKSLYSLFLSLKQKIFPPIFSWGIIHSFYLTITHMGSSHYSITVLYLRVGDRLIYG